MVSAINNIKVSHGHWKRGASDLDLYEAVQELLENAMDNGTGISSTFFAEEASSLGHTRGYTAKHLVDKKGLGRHGGGMKNSLPPLADDVYTFVCHGHGKDRERYIVRNGETLNKALVTDGKESLQWAYLPVPTDFVYKAKLDKDSGISAAVQLLAKTPEKMTQIVLEGTKMMLAGEDSAFKDSLAALLDLFKEFGEGTGTMFVIAAPCSEPPNRLIPATLNGRPDLVREDDDPANRTSVSQHIAQIYILDPLFRGLREALWNAQNAGRAFEDLPIKFYVQRQKHPVDFGTNSIVAASKASGVVSPVIPILHPRGTLGWLLLAYQDKEATPRFNMANNKRSGLHMAIVCRMLKPEPSFFSKSDSQSQFMIKAEYFERKHAYDHLEDMLSVDESLLEGVPEEMRPKMPFSLEDAISWNKRAGSRNHYWTLGGAGVTGVFVANEAIFTVNVDKDDLKDSQLTAFLHAKLMEHMMAWVYANPPPDMMAAMTQHEQYLAKKAAAAAARAAKAAAMKAAREAQGAVKREEAAPKTPKRSTSARAAKSKASSRITSKLALEGAPEHVALGAYLRKVSASATKKSAKRQLQPEDSNDVTAPKTPVAGQQEKRPRQADSIAGSGGDANVDLEWEAFLGEPAKRRAADASITAATLIGRKVMAVVADTPSAEQLQRLDAMFKALGKMPVG
ncbi:hypothetical protein WJX75_002074 [Coccomyxa subellipsoidea]|uniref:ATP-binding protein n=1 Tax=Coccomyxa subellipsoidea TaxID=248742 RepID=A0ABR2YX91_9CHLO